MKKYIFFMFFVFFFSCEEYKHHVSYNNGLNLITNENDKIEEFYVINNQLNGVHITYLDSPVIYGIGTFSNNKRNGLWDTAISNNNSVQYFYRNDTIESTFKHKYYFEYLKFINYDFTVLNPISWQITDSLKTKAYLISMSSTFKDKVKPRYTIYRLEQSEEDIVKIIDNYYENEVKVDTSIIQFDRISSCRYSLLTKNGKDSLLYDVKLVKTTSGTYCISCLCSYSYFSYYYYIFETILNSFNPASSIPQK